MKALVAWRRGLFFDRRKDRGVVCIISTFSASGSVCGSMCVYTHTHTHTAQMGYLDVSPGVGMRHLEGPENPDILNLGIHIFVYVYKIHMCMYMLIVSNVKYKIWAHRPSIKGTKPLFIAIKAIIIIIASVVAPPEQSDYPCRAAGGINLRRNKKFEQC